jgi:hypothetical protein
LFLAVGLLSVLGGGALGETETALQQFAAYILEHGLARERAAPHIVRWGAGVS